MAPAFSKEAILTGEIDHLCLVCENYMRSTYDVTTHITKPAHRKKLESTNYVEKYKQDRIRKIKKWYYCEFCNILLSTLTKVGLHVEESKHNENKSSIVIVRKGDLVILLEDVAINEESWHGLIDGTCTLCNNEFDDSNAHKNESSHIINLIKSKVSNIGKNIYRKIDECTFHCLTCNAVVAEIISHLDETKHKNLLEKCRSETPTAFENEVASDKISTTESVTKEESIANEINVINVVDSVTPSEHMKPTNNPRTTTTEIEKASDEHNCDVKFDQYICEALKTEDYIYRDEKGLLTCILCNWKINPFEVRHHLDGEHHKTILKMHNKRGKALSTAVKSPEIAKDTKNTSNVLNFIEHFQKNNININFESQTAICKTCSKNIDFNSEVIESHIQEHKKVVQKENVAATTPNIFKKNESNKMADSEKLFTSPVYRTRAKNDDKDDVAKKLAKQKKDDDEDITKLADQHNLTYNLSSKTIYCPRCNKHIPFSILNINEHIFGALHKINATIEPPTQPSSAASNNGKKPKDISHEVARKMNPKKCELVKVPTIIFIENLVTIENFFAQDVVVNEKFCIHFHSFSFLAISDNNERKCLLCNVSFDNEDHFENEKHQRALKEMLVIINIESEFIREISSGSYHCGFCNVVESSWEAMEDHLKLSSHKESKNSAQWRLLQYMPDIERNRLNRRFQHSLNLRDLFTST